MAIKVRCCVCSNENLGKCALKKEKVSVNKKRRCKFFVLAREKLKLSEELPSVRVKYGEEEKLKKLKRANRGGLPLTHSQFPD